MRRGEGFQFEPDVESAAHRRQKGLCALCGKTVSWMYSPSHAVYPVHAGDSAAGDWKKGLDNCVILCESCYGWTSDDNAYPITAPTMPEEFKFSHGRLKGAHSVWRIRMMGR